MKRNLLFFITIFICAGSIYLIILKAFDNNIVQKEDYKLKYLLNVLAVPAFSGEIDDFKYFVDVYNTNQANNYDINLDVLIDKKYKKKFQNISSDGKKFY